MTVRFFFRSCESVGTDSFGFAGSMAVQYLLSLPSSLLLELTLSSP
jgi:hypothetical protein